MVDITRMSVRVRKVPVPFQPPASPTLLSLLSGTGRRRVRRKLQCSAPPTVRRRRRIMIVKSKEEDPEVTPTRMSPKLSSHIQQ